MSKVVEYQINQKKENLINLMKSKGPKKGVSVKVNEKLSLSVTDESVKKAMVIPVTLEADIQEDGDNSILRGKYKVSIFWPVSVVVAAILIIVRLIASIVQKQMDNVIMCAVVTILLILVVWLVEKKSKPAKKIIEDFLSDLNRK